MDWLMYGVSAALVLVALFSDVQKFRPPNESWPPYIRQMSRITPRAVVLALLLVGLTAMNSYLLDEQQESADAALGRIQFASNEAIGRLDDAKEDLRLVQGGIDKAAIVLEQSSKKLDAAVKAAAIGIETQISIFANHLSQLESAAKWEEIMLIGVAMPNLVSADARAVRGRLRLLQIAAVDQIGPTDTQKVLGEARLYFREAESVAKSWNELVLTEELKLQATATGRSLPPTVKFPPYPASTLARNDANPHELRLAIASIDLVLKGVESDAATVVGIRSIYYAGERARLLKETVESVRNHSHSD